MACDGESKYFGVHHHKCLQCAKVYKYHEACGMEKGIIRHGEERNAQISGIGNMKNNARN
jgi:hypothetical protein